MIEFTDTEKTTDRLASLKSVLSSGAMKTASRMLNSMHPAEIADLLESLPTAQRKFIWDMVNPEYDGDVLMEVGEEVRESLVRDMEPEELLAAVNDMDTDDVADLILSLPETVIRETLLSMDKQRRQQVESVLSYPDDTAGGLMDLDVTTVRPDVTLDVVLRYLRRLGDLPDHTDRLMVVNRHNHFLGSILLKEVLVNPLDTLVSEIMDQDEEILHVEMPEQQVAQVFRDHDLISAPVVNSDNKLLGRITIDDVVDVITDEAEKSVRSLARLNEDEDIFSPIIKSTRRRSVWLGINLLTAFIAAWAIGLFQATIEQVVALAVLMPIVPSMGGIAGNQTLILVIRAQALGQIGLSNFRSLITKEVTIGLLNGLLWAVAVAIFAILWFQDIKIGGIIAAAMLINLIAASFAGVMLPMILRQLNIDPALAGGVILTTVTDVIGYGVFLAIATVILMP